MTVAAINEVNHSMFVKVSSVDTFTKYRSEALYEYHRTVWPQIENRPPPQ